MIKTKQTRIAVPAISAPQTVAECSALIARIGLAQRRRQQIETAMNDELAIVRERYESKARHFKGELDGLSKAVQAYCEANRLELTEAGSRKFFRFASGEVQWRMRPRSVTVRKVEEVLAALIKLGLDRFVRAKVELDKAAVLKEPDVASKIKGITISQGEDFVVKPWDTFLEEVL